MSRVALICASLAVVLGATTYTGTVSTIRRAAMPQPPSQTDDEIQTGSILFLPPRGNACWQRYFDNRTGELWDHGSVPCDVAMTRGRGGAPGPQSTLARVDGLSQHFRGP